MNTYLIILEDRKKKHLLLYKFCAENEGKAITLASEKCSGSIVFREIYQIDNELMYQPICGIGVGNGN